MTGVLVVTRYHVPPAEGPAFAADAGVALAVLSARAGCLSARLGRATDEPDRWVLVSRWESVGAYRRALSAYEVKLHVVPLLSRCVDEPTAFEVLAEAAGGEVVTHASARADDADPAGPGAPPPGGGGGASGSALG